LLDRARLAEIAHLNSASRQHRHVASREEPAQGGRAGAGEPPAGPWG
jgi:hypothetical protein